MVVPHSRRDHPAPAAHSLHNALDPITNTATSHRAHLAPADPITNTAANVQVPPATLFRLLGMLQRKLQTQWQVCLALYRWIPRPGPHTAPQVQEINMEKAISG